jgi:hypothetical protein
VQHDRLDEFLRLLAGFLTVKESEREAVLF